MKSLFNLYKKYQNINQLLHKMTTLKEVSLATLFAAITALAILAPFVLALIPLFTFTNLLALWITLSFIVGIGVIFSYYWFLYFYLKKLNPKTAELKLKYLIIVEFVSVSLLLIIIGGVFTYYILGRM